MGRIKQTYIKRIAEKLVEDYGKEFGTDFDKNKKQVDELCDVRSKPIRNKIAGYITRVMKIQERERKKEAAVVVAQ